MLICAESVGKTYKLGVQTVTALRAVSLNIDAGAFIALSGPSGSGKSTLLNIIGLIDTPTSGRLLIDGHDVTNRPPEVLAHLRARSIGFVFQTFNLLPVLTAEENVEFPLLQFREFSIRQRRDRVAQLLDLVKLSDHARHRPNQLSGGQRQRVAIARALATGPRIVLADEPTANLDHRTGTRILRLMRRINRMYGTTFIFSTHDPRVIEVADRRVDIEDGAIVRLGVRNGKTWTYAAERTASTPDDLPDELPDELN
ncbi:MAG: ABC transporter ATP-binding protein [Proteobacteria bacterium]|jgi:putative ABC transport system ATP-binding protein|nr:ABC transporter ATP-binding protein [Pseudomonadota bacterium]